MYGYLIDLEDAYKTVDFHLWTIALSQENDSLRSVILSLHELLESKDSSLYDKNAIIAQMRMQLLLQANQVMLCEKAMEPLREQNKKLRLGNVFWKVMTGVCFGFGIYMSVK